MLFDSKIVRATIACALAIFFGASTALAHPPANSVGDDVPLTGGDAARQGVIPQNYDAPVPGIYKDTIGELPEPEATATPEPTSSASNAAPIVDGVGARHDTTFHGVTPGEALYNRTSDASVLDPLNWSVTVHKRSHQLTVSYKGEWFGTYRAVFGRNLDTSSKNFEGDRRTPEGRSARR